jgi:hypothetical protein
MKTLPQVRKEYLQTLKGCLFATVFPSLGLYLKNSSITKGYCGLEQTSLLDGKGEVIRKVIRRRTGLADIHSVELLI